MEKGLVFNIQKYSIHDGPGIRTTVFLKGCPLSCWWCHNPESQSEKREIMYFKNRCTGCGLCVQKCPQYAVKLLSKEKERPGKVVRDSTKCLSCGECLKNCPSGALEMVGEMMSVDEIIAEVERDTIFYDQSGGGVTLSGGEPLLQSGLVRELVRYFQKTEVSVAIDTCGFVPWKVLEEVAPAVDYFLYDLKFIDTDRHQKYTGVGNKRILDNLSRLARRDLDLLKGSYNNLDQDNHFSNGDLSENNYQIFGRIPLIPGINDDRENIEGIGQFFMKQQIKKVNLLPYHNTGLDKYQRLGREYKLHYLEPPVQERIDYLVSLLKELGLQVEVGA